VVFASLVLTGLFVAPQQTAAPQQHVLDELKGIRGTLEKMETSQRMLLALLRIQIDEARLPSAERERETLATQQRALSDELGALRAAMDGLPPTSSLTVSDAKSMREDSMNGGQSAREHVDEVARKLADVRRSLRQLDQSISETRARIATWEKYFNDLMR
jgi:hypothetical protein